MAVAETGGRAEACKYSPMPEVTLTGQGERRQFTRVNPSGDEMKEEEVPPYPTSIGRGMHTPEYIEELRRDSEPRS